MIVRTNQKLTAASESTNELSLKPKEAERPGHRRLIAVLNDRWRVADDPLQWILQVRKGRSRRGDNGYRGRCYCVCRAALIRFIEDYCGEVDRHAMVAIRALSRRHPYGGAHGGE